MRKLTIGENFVVNRYYLRLAGYEFFETENVGYIKRMAIPDNSNNKLNDQYLYTYMNTEEGIKNIILYFGESGITFFEADSDDIIGEVDSVKYIIDSANNIRNKRNYNSAIWVSHP